MITCREHYIQALFTIDTPTGLSSKPGVVLATKTFYDPNYLSIPGDNWVRSSDGAILTCEQLFDALTNQSQDTDTQLVRLTDYDFQDMYEDQDQKFDDLAAAYVNLSRVVEKTTVDVYDQTDKKHKEMRYGDLLVPGSVVKFKGRAYSFSIEGGTSLLEGYWTDNESWSRSTYEFLLYVRSEGGPIELTYTV